MIFVLIVLFYVTWIFYLAVMSLKRERTKLSRAAIWMSLPILIFGFAMDALFNLMMGSVLFMEIPHEILFTARCDRWLKDKKWRGRMARWFCRNLLDPFDDGGHCR